MSKHGLMSMFSQSTCAYSKRSYLTLELSGGVRKHSISDARKHLEKHAIEQSGRMTCSMARYDNILITSIVFLAGQKRTISNRAELQIEPILISYREPKSLFEEYI